MKTPNEIHAYLAIRYGRGYVTTLAQRLSESMRRPISKKVTSTTINGKQRNEEVRKAIAADSNMSVEDFFEPDFDVFVGLKEKAAA